MSGEADGDGVAGASGAAGAGETHVDGSPAASAGDTHVDGSPAAAASAGAPAMARTTTALSFKAHSTRPSYQLRALARKSVSYQRRQVCSTCCCVFLCPFFMVLICGLLGIIITNLIANLSSSAAVNVTYCSSANASDPATLLPLSFDQVPKDASGRYQLNIAADGYCVEWFGHQYPNSYPYSPASAATCPPNYNPDICPLQASSTLSTPPSGWLTTPPLVYQLLGIVSASQFNFWSLVTAAPGVDVGSRPAPTPVSLYATGPLTSTVNTSGFLGDIRGDFYFPVTNNFSNPAALQVESRPYFSNESYDLMSLDATLKALISNAINTIAALTDPDPLNNLPNTDPVKVAYEQARAEALNSVPYGALIVDELGPNAFEYTLQVGTNRRLAYQSSPFPTEGIRRLLYQSRLTQAIMAQNTSLSNGTITQGLRLFPENSSTGFSIPIASFIGQILYPFGVSFLLPVFVLALVKDKEERVLIMMKMNGLKMWAYYATEYVLFYTLHVISTIIFICTGLIFQLDFFTLTAPGVYILLFFLWGNVQIVMAFLLSIFFSRSRTALLVTYLLVVLGIIINVAVSFVFAGAAPVGYFIYPPFAFYRGILVLNSAAFSVDSVPYNMSMVVPGSEVYMSVVAMIAQIFLLGIIALYLSLVWPSEYGLRKRWHFPITDTWEWIKQMRAKHNARRHAALVSNTYAMSAVGTSTAGMLPTRPADPIAEAVAEEDAAQEVEDDDVADERVRVNTRQFPITSSLVMHSMRKAFGPTKVAVKGVSLAVDSDTIFGLLGPNGAGKTTLINILTGLYEATDGDATIDGYRLGTQMRDVYMSIGVCPQHDILWGDLTVEDHLLFYARLKGVGPAREKTVVDAMLANMSLERFRTRQTKGLSGGEKRRVSIAIALIGESKVVFLDEPTTGLDPEVRRLIWEIVNRERKGKTIVLTTHSMEEAEVLCQKIGIMAKGSLRCLGTPLHLKNKFGSGFKLTATCKVEDGPTAQAYMESLLPPGFKRMDAFAGTFTYEFPNAEGVLATLFEELGKNSAQHGIQDWGVSQTTLEEVFLAIVSEHDAQAD